MTDIPKPALNQHLLNLFTKAVNGIFLNIRGAVPDAAVAQKIAQQLMSNGSSSAPVSALLIHNMTDGHNFTTERGSALLEKLLAHHLFEVVSDELPAKYVHAFNNLAIRLIDGSLTLEQLASDPEYQFLQSELGEIKTKMTVGSRSLTVGEALSANLKAVAWLTDEFETFSPEWCAYIKAALSNRYRAVNQIQQGGYRGDLDTAINLRSNAILIKVTMATVLHALAAENVLLKEYLEANSVQIQSAIDSGAKLIGIWNDLGSSLTLEIELQTSFLNWINTLPVEADLRAYLKERLRSYFEQLKQADEDADTEQIVTVASDNFGAMVNWDKLRQPLKDAVHNEPNLFFDNLGDKTELLLQIIEVIVDEMNQLKNNLRIQKESEAGFIVSILVAASVAQHQILYGGAGDYYDNREDTFLIELRAKTAALVVEYIS